MAGKDSPGQHGKNTDEEAETVTTPMHPAAVIRSIENALSDEA